MKVAMMNNKPGTSIDGIINQSNHSNGGVSNHSNGSASDVVSSPKERYIESMNPVIRRQKDLLRTVQQFQQKSAKSNISADNQNENSGG